MLFIKTGTTWLNWLLFYWCVCFQWIMFSFVNIMDLRLHGGLFKSVWSRCASFITIALPYISIRTLFSESCWILHHNKTSKHKSSNSCWAFLMPNDFLTVTVMFLGSRELKNTVEAAPDVYKACRPNWPQYQHFNTCFIPDAEFETLTVYQTQLDSTTKINAPWRRRSTPFLRDMLPPFCIFVENDSYSSRIISPNTHKKLC